MNTKGILIAILALGSITLINAQQPAGYFFKEFTPGKVLLKNKQFAKGKFNYDCINKEMHFASVYVTGQNLFYITGYEGTSPEPAVSTEYGRGIDNGRYPTPRTVLFGLSVSF